MVHLFLTDGSHKMFKEAKTATGTAFQIPKNEDTEILYAWSGGVGYFSKPQQFILIPIHRVQEIHITRKAGEGWQ